MNFFLFVRFVIICGSVLGSVGSKLMKVIIYDEVWEEEDDDLEELVVVLVELV